MRNFPPIWRLTRYALFTVALFFAGEAIVLAKDAEESSSRGGSGVWVMAYMFVLLAVALGMIVVCRSSGRRERAKPEAYVEAKKQVKE